MVEVLMKGTGQETFQERNQQSLIIWWGEEMTTKCSRINSEFHNWE